MASGDSSYGTVSKDFLYVKVSDTICSYICTEGLKAGDRLPSERFLAHKFSVGRNTVREALKTLVEQGILEVSQGKGTFVKENFPDGSLRLKLMKVNYRELLDIRIWLEQLAIHRAVERASNADLQRLSELSQQMLAEAEKNIFSMQLDRKFHALLLELSGMRMLVSLVLSLTDGLNEYLDVLIDSHDVWLKTVPFHDDLVEALKNNKS
ncbi:MAG: hypothetical protein CSA76_04705 [Spirochaetales bacterium]|nr:MAG: hypothetical protein CSA76_04705 [Spirochaetales bacterium]